MAFLFFGKMNNENISFWGFKEIPFIDGEEWRDVDGWNGCYLISNFGRVKSVRPITSKRSKHGGRKLVRLVKPYKNPGGYLVAGMKVHSRRDPKHVHVLVAKAFIDNPENKRTVNHIDGNKLNNHVSNLEWATHGENHFHAYETGLREHGEKHCAAKVKNKDIPRIFEMRRAGMFQWQIGEAVGCDRRQVGRILNGKRRIRCVKEYVNDEL